MTNGYEKERKMSYEGSYALNLLIINRSKEEEINNKLL